MAEEKYISGEQFHDMPRVVTAKSAKKVTIKLTPVVIIITAVVLSGLSFAAGVSYQKHHATSSSVTTTNGFSSTTGGSRRLGSIGQVTAISPTSLSETDQRSGSTNTYAITAVTAITNNGQTVATSSIQVGDTVLVSTSRTDASTAIRIVVNPSFGGSGFGPSPATTQNN